MVTVSGRGTSADGSCRRRKGGGKRDPWVNQKEEEEGGPHENGLERGYSEGKYHKTTYLTDTKENGRTITGLDRRSLGRHVQFILHNPSLPRSVS